MGRSSIIKREPAATLQTRLLQSIDRWTEPLENGRPRSALLEAAVAAKKKKFPLGDGFET